MEIWDIPTIQDAIDLCHGTQYGDVFRFAIYTGMRRSEICGLKWESVDLIGGRLSVERTLHHITGQGLVEGLPKTKRSRRNIPLAQETVNLLIASRAVSWTRDCRPAAGHMYSPRPNGLPLLPQEVTEAFTQLVREKNLPHLTLHGLRHANTTLQLAAGVNLKVVSEGLGHSSIGVTLDLYSHVLPNMQQHAVDAVAELLKRE